MRYNLKKHGEGWELWENAIEDLYEEETLTVSGTAFPETFVCFLTADEILEIFNETVPRTVSEPYLKGREDCTHAWRPWKFNDSFMRCNKCPAMHKIKRLVPREYK